MICKHCAFEIKGAKGDYWHCDERLGVEYYGMKCFDDKNLAEPEEDAFIYAWEALYPNEPIFGPGTGETRAMRDRARQVAEAMKAYAKSRAQ